MYVWSVACGAKTAHAVHRKPEYEVGDYVTFFCHQNGAHQAVIVHVTGIHQYSSYISLVRGNRGTLVPYAAQRGNRQFKIDDYTRNETTVHEYLEYRWLLTERITTRKGCAIMTVAEFNRTKPWLVTFELVVAQQ